MSIDVEGLDMEALETVARGVASIGSWRCGPNMLNGGLTVNDAVGSIADILSDGPGEYIATFDPPTVLRLLAALRAQAERVRVLEGERDLATFVAALISEGCQRFRHEAEGRSIDESRWIARFSAIREASGIGYKPMLAEVPGAIAERIAAAEARAEAAERRAGELEGALNGIADDYMTSESHHPDHVLIPKAKFEQLAALAPTNPQEPADD